MHVPLGDHLVTRLQIDVLEPPRQVDAATLAHIDWLYYESFRLFSIKLCLQLLLFTREHPGFWEEVVFFFEHFTKTHQVPG